MVLIQLLSYKTLHAGILCQNKMAGAVKVSSMSWITSVLNCWYLGEKYVVVQSQPDEITIKFVHQGFHHIDCRPNSDVLRVLLSLCAGDKFSQIFMVLLQIDFMPRIGIKQPCIQLWFSPLGRSRFHELLMKACREIMSRIWYSSQTTAVRKLLMAIILLMVHRSFSFLKDSDKILHYPS